MAKKANLLLIMIFGDLFLINYCYKFFSILEKAL